MFKAKFYAGQGSANVIADVYSVIGNPNARILLERLILRRTNDYFFITALLNAGEEYANNKDYNNALLITTNLILFKIKL
jgi:hypothetical protein